MRSQSADYVESRLEHSPSISTNKTGSDNRHLQGHKGETRTHRSALAAASIAMTRAHDRARHWPCTMSDRVSRSGESEGTDNFQTPSLRSTQSCRSLRRSAFSPDIPPVPKIPEEYLRQTNHGHSRGCSALTDSIVSGPLSPVKGLRRARSMFSIRRRLSKSTSFELSKERGEAMQRNADTKYLSRRTLKRSQPLMKSNAYRCSRKSDCSYGSEIAVQMAREKFLEDFRRQEAEMLNSRQEIALPSNAKKPFKRSVRSTTSTTDPTRVSMDAPSCFNDSFVDRRYTESKARKLSTTIKNGLKRMFRLSSFSGDSGSSSRNRSHGYFHLGDYLHGDTSVTDECYYSRNTDECYRGHAFQCACGDERYSSEAARKASGMHFPNGNDVGVADASDSRATSWTDSTVTASRVRPVGSASQHLSIIDEQGDTQNRCPSTLTSYHDGYSVFRQPLHSSYEGSQQVDSQEVYSALLRRMDGSQKENDHEGGKNPTQSFMDNGRRNAFDYGPRPSNCTRVSPRGKSLTGTCSSVRNASQQSMRSVYLGEAIGCTPQEMADLNEGLSRQASVRTLRDSRRHGFFSSRPAKRNLMPTSIISSQPSKPKTSVTSDEDTGSIIVSRPQKSCEASPSVYSRADSETPLTATRHTVLEMSQTPEETGTAIILANERIPYPPKARSAADFVSKHWPGKGSAEWRSWVSSQMDTITINEPKPYLDDAIVSKGTTQHYREHAQFDDDVFTDAGSSPRTQTEATQDQTPTEGDHRAKFKHMVQSAFSQPLRLSPSNSRTVSQTSVRKPSIVKNSIQVSPSVASAYSPPVKRTPSTRLSVSPFKTPTESPLANKQNKFTLSPSVLSTSQQSKSAFLNRPRLGTTARRVRREVGGINDENVPAHKPATGTSTDEDGVGTGSPREYRSPASSKRMVDLFLSERRRQMNESEETAAGSAFI
ncbi:hypothetical protein KEM54_006593 [Ascosphaera aggregata]|nr:hypothetical protein KEM54_006593 [Ascosphaera aggregata]